MGDELTTTPDAEFMTVKDYDPKLKGRAYELFLSSGMSAVDIAIDTGVPQHVIATWIKQGGWRTRKTEIENELMRCAEDEYRRIIMKNRGPVVQRHLDNSAKLENMIGDVTDRLLNGEELPKGLTTELRRLTESLASVTGVSARAAAISDKPFQNLVDQENQKKQKQPLITLNFSVAPPPGYKEPKVVDMEGEE
jgi:transposase-like protein